MTPLVSILIPCYNAARWLPAALDSALAQTYPRCEIIVMDDGSTDGSLAAAGAFEARGVRVFTQPNSGQCAACNHALRRAGGDFIKFFDADDLLGPEAIAAQVAALTGKPGRLAYGTWARFHDDPTAAVFKSHPGWHDGTGLDWLKETWIDTEPMYQCGLFLIPRELLNRAGGWDERLSLINDFEFFSRLVLAAEGIVFTPQAKLYYRSNISGSLSAQKSRRAWESAVLSTNLAVDHLLAKEDAPFTRRLSANMLQKLVYAFYPEHPDLRRELLARIGRLGGSDLRPAGGQGFQELARITGWRFAARLRYLAGRRPV